MYTRIKSVIYTDICLQGEWVYNNGLYNETLQFRNMVYNINYFNKLKTQLIGKSAMSLAIYNNICAEYGSMT